MYDSLEKILYTPYRLGTLQVQVRTRYLYRECDTDQPIRKCKRECCSSCSELKQEKILALEAASIDC